MTSSLHLFASKMRNWGFERILDFCWDIVSKKISNNTSEEMDANVNALFNYLRLESEKVKHTVNLYPITKQIENIDVNEFTDIIRHQLVTNDDSKTKSNKTKSNKIKSNKIKSNKTKSNKTKSNKSKSNK